MAGLQSGIPCSAPHKVCGLTYVSVGRLQVDPAERRLAQWTRCQLSGEALAHPVVSDELGHLFNKDAIVAGALHIARRHHCCCLVQIW